MYNANVDDLSTLLVGLRKASVYLAYYRSFKNGIHKIYNVTNMHVHVFVIMNM